MFALICLYIIYNLVRICCIFLHVNFAYVLHSFGTIFFGGNRVSIGRAALAKGWGIGDFNRFRLPPFLGVYPMGFPKKRMQMIIITIADASKQIQKKRKNMPKRMQKNCHKKRLCNQKELSQAKILRYTCLARDWESDLWTWSLPLECIFQKISWESPAPKEMDGK